MTHFFENIAHFTHGMAFMFFAFVSLETARTKNKSRFMKFLFWEMLMWAFIQFKDILYLMGGIWRSDYLMTLQLSVDTWSIPVTMIFMFELLSPRWATPGRIVCATLPSVLFTAAFAICGSKLLFRISLVYTVILGVAAVVVVWLTTSRYDNYVKKNFSYTEEIGVSWLRTVISLLFVCLFVWALISWNAGNWLGDAVYHIIFVSVWIYLYFYSVDHKVIDVPSMLNPFAVSPKDHINSGQEEIQSGRSSYPFEQKLKHCMEEERLFLNPKLAITDVAGAIGTNRTYLSEYLNSSLNTTFYDFINGFRVEMAKGLLADEPRTSLEEIAERCGFNSLSTFHRSFLKSTGCTPAKFRNSRGE